MTYIDNTTEPRDQIPRIVTITHPHPTFSPCSIAITVINIKDLPVISISDAYSFTYTEDSGAELVSNTTISIMDSDNSRLRKAMIYISNTPTEFGSITDSLRIGPGFTDRSLFRSISGEATNSFSVETRVPQLHSVFTSLLSNILFETNDQATDITRNLTLVVQEFDNDPSLPAVIPILIEQLNDRPVFISEPLVTGATLDDYIPNNEGFDPAYLLDDSVISDPDSAYPPNPDFIGLAIFNYSSNAVIAGGFSSSEEIGVWQYWENGSWVNFMPVSECSPLFIFEAQRIRFKPSPRMEKEDGLANISYWVWDGTSTTVCSGSSLRTDNESPISSASKSFSYSVNYLNRPPVINFAGDSFPLPSIYEDNATNGSIVYNIVNSIASDADDSPLMGLAFVNSTLSNGVWQYNDNVTHNNWTDFPSNLSSSYALHLPMGYAFRFLPDENFVGYSSVRVHAWDLSNIVQSSPYFSPVVVSPTGAYSPSALELTIEVMALNDPPVISLANDNITFIEADPSITIFSSLSISDVDDTNLTSAIVTLSCPNCLHGFYRSSTFLRPAAPDELEHLSDPNFNVTLVETNTTLQYLVSPAMAAEASISDFIALLSSFKFEDIMEEPSIFDRVVSLYVHDSTSMSNIVTVTVFMQQVNDNPPSIELPFNSIDYTEGSGALEFNFSSLSIISDVDESLDLQSLEVVLLGSSASSDESISTTYTSPSISITSSNDTSLLFTGPSSLATFNDVINSISYTNNEDEPGSVSREVQFVINDGRYTNTPPASLIIRIQPINDHTPVVDLGATTTITYQEQNPISGLLAIFPDITVSDGDVPVTPVLGAMVEIVNPLDGSSEVLKLNGTVSNIQAQFANASLHIHSVGGASITAQDVQDALRLVTYQNTAQEPNPTTRNVTVMIGDVLDGRGLVHSAPATLRIEFSLANDPPQIILGQSVIRYTESQEPQLLSPSAIITDVDDTALAGLVITLTVNLTDYTYERLSINDSLILGVIDLNSTNTEIILTGTASITVYEGILQSLSYGNKDLDPETEVRLVTVTPIGVGTGPGMSDSVKIEFETVNNPPTLDLNGGSFPGSDYNVDFVEESQTPVNLVSDGVLLTDVDNTTLLSVAISLTPYLDQGYEEIQIQTTPNIDVLNNSPVSIELRGVGGSAPITAFTNALKTLTYINRADEPSVAARMVSFIASDGIALSDEVLTYIMIIPQNDRPELNLTSSSKNYLTSWTENEPPVIMTSSPSVRDIDSSLFTRIRVRDVTQISGDQVMLTGHNLVVDANHSNIRVATLSTPLNATALQDLLSTLSFSSVSNEPPPGDREYCVYVSDGYSWSSPACVEITFIPVNDNPPVISPVTASETVPENTNIALATRFSVTDLDDANSSPNLTWAIISGDDCHQSASAMNMFSFSGDNSTTNNYIVDELPCRFSIDNNGLITASGLDRETRDFYALNVSVSDGSFTDYAELTVTVSDRNDNPTCFSPRMYNTSVSLGDKAGTQLALLNITDMDASIPGIFVRIIGIAPSSAGLSNAFHVYNNGTLTLNINEFDQAFIPEQSIYVLEVDIEDYYSGKSAKENGCQAFVSVEVPINAHSPVFTSPSYSFSIPENTTVNTPVNLTVAATDDDEGSNGEILYDPIEGLFSIDRNTGSISVRAGIDLEVTGPEYIFTVTARDKGKTARTATVNVTAYITDVNEFTPSFNRSFYVAVICENTPIGTEVLQVMATDEDAGSFGQLTYSITSPTCCFDINATTGAIYVKSIIDFEAGNYVHTLLLAATDLGERTSFTFVEIRVVNDNDNHPTFSSQSINVSISENFPVGIPLTSQLTATDGDIYCRRDQCNGIIVTDNSSCRNEPTIPTYAIESGNEAGLFSINSLTGIISPARVIDHESLNKTTFTLNISATDGLYTSYATFTIDILNVSEFAPVFDMNNYTASIDEREPVGTLILTVHASDDDNSPFTYSLSGDDASYFSINPNNGEVRTARDIDYETKQFFSLLLVASEVAMPNMTGYASLVIRVNDTNDNAPAFVENQYQFNLLENSPPHTTVGTVEANDADSGQNAVFYYSILSVQPPSYSNAFTVNSSSGEIRSAQSFDREEREQYTLVVSATDTGGLNSSVVVIVNVSDANDNAPIMDNTTLTLPEDTPLNTVILQLISTDEDTSLNSVVTYSLEDDYNGTFAIHSSGDQLIVAQSLDYETIQSYDLIVILNNSGYEPPNVLTSSARVTVYVTDVNDNAPVFTSPESASIFENASIGAPVLTLSATDADQDGAQTVSFVIPDSYSGPFSLSSNEVRVAGALDRETKELHYVPVIAYNPHSLSGPNSTQTLNITLLDVNDNSPQFSSDPFRFSVAEDHTPSVGDVMASSGYTEQLVGIVFASDIDESSNAAITYYLSQVDPSLPFTVNPQSGGIYSTSPLDYEQMTTYTFNVTARDNGTPALSTTALVVIGILDINDNAPVFTEFVYNASVLESIAMNGFITQVSAFDDDSGMNAAITFSLADPTLPFYINGSQILLKASSLDRETVDQYVFDVIAKDRGRPPLNSTAQVRVTVIDVNDNAPTITPVFLNTSIQEDTAVGTVIARFNVSDADIGSNAVTTLSLVGQSSHFIIDQDGVVRVRTPLDYDTGNTTFSITLRARNTDAMPQLMSLYPFNFSLININDNAPSIEFDKMSVSFDEGRSAVPLDVGFNISDPDTKDFTQIHDAKIEFIDPNPLELSLPFSPTTAEDPSYCPLEDKATKLLSCGFTANFELTEDGEDLTQLPQNNILSSDDTTLVLNAAQGNYAHITASYQFTNFSMVSWIWYTQTASPATIFAYVADGYTVFSAVCHSADLVFTYYNDSAQHNATFTGACSALTTQWHHLALTVNPLQGYPVLTVFIDGLHYASTNIRTPQDGDNKRLFIGARPLQGRNVFPVHDYFTGRLHRLAFGSSPITDIHINCLIGCGVYLYSSSLPPPVLYHYNYTTRQLYAEGAGEVKVYEDFLNSIIFVIAFSEPRSLDYNVDYTVTDGIFSSVPVRLNITLNPTNDGSPNLALNGALGANFVANYVEEGGPVRVVNSSSLSLTDVDLVPYPYIVNATILHSQQPEGDEVLQVSYVPQGMTAVYSGYSLVLSGFLTIDQYELALRTLTYDNYVDEPLGDSRTISIVVNDSPRKSNTAYTTLYIRYVNDLPVLSVRASTAKYSEGDGLVSLLMEANITDDDNMTLVSARIEFFAPDESLEFLFVDTSNTNIVSTYMNNVLLLSGEDNLDSYASVISSLTYENNKTDNITGGTRVFNIRLFDGADYSSFVQTSLFIEGVNDPPTVDLNGGNMGNSFVRTFTEDSDEVIPAVSPDLSLIDVDSSTLEYVRIEFLTRPDAEQETILIDTQGKPFTFSSTGNVYTLAPNSLTMPSVHQFQQVLRTLRYRNTAEEPTPGLHSLVLTVNDGIDSSLPAYINITVVSVNDPPYIDLDTTQDGTGFSGVFIEESNIPTRLASANLSVTDNDINAVIMTVTVTISGVADGYSEAIVSLAPNVILPNPTMPSSSVLVYAITPSDGSLSYVSYLISVLAYNNSRLEPSPGERQVSVSLYDGFNASNTAVSLITVETINEDTPTFTQSFSGRIYENEPARSFVVRVTAMDSDSGSDGRITYSIFSVSPSVGMDRFIIGSTNGEIRTNVSLDREDIDMYNITVAATDAGPEPKSSLTVVPVTVEDRNDNPPYFPQPRYFISIPESTQAFTTIDIVSADDPDEHQPSDIFYELVSSFFQILPNGELRLSRSLDADSSQNVYNITITATDTFGQTGSTVYTITITDVNDNTPAFSQSTYQSFVPENLVDAYVATISASDADSTSNAEISYSFGNLEDLQTFSIDNVTGEIRTVTELDREGQQSYDIIALATDHGEPPLTGTATVSVTVLDLNDNAPSFSQAEYPVSVSENIANAFVATVNATDPDNATNSSITYSLPSNVTLFRIDGASGDIYTVGSLDRESAATRVFNVYATDGGSPGLYSFAVVRVTVLDVNDNSPTFIGGPYSGGVPENEANYLILTVQASDADAGSNADLRYQLMNHGDLFSLDPTTGELRSSRGLDFESRCFYQLHVSVADSGNPSRNSSTLVDVSVTPHNDHPPTFSSPSYSAQIREELPAGTYVTQVLAVDNDTTLCALGFTIGSGSGLVPDLTPMISNITYSLLNFNNDFQINANTGIVTTRSEIDRETKSSYLLSVSATEVDSNLTSTATIYVAISDINDNAPSFTQGVYSREISESTPVGTEILQVIATDADLVDQGRLSYHLFDSNTPFINISSRTGMIYLSQPVDFEEIGSASHTFTVEVTDTANFFDNAFITITIKDTNDLPPFIATVSSTLQFVEGSLSLRPFPSINITDPDLLQNLHSANISLSTPINNTAPNCICTNSSLATSCTPGCVEFLLIDSKEFPGNVTQSSNGQSLILSGNYSIDTYEATILSVMYVNLLSNPYPLHRLASLTVNDGILDSNILINTIQIVPLNQHPPVIDLNGPGVSGSNYSVVFTEEGEAVGIVSPLATITDNDTVPVLTRLSVTLVNPQDGDSDIIRFKTGTVLPDGITMLQTSTVHNIVLEGVGNLTPYTELLKQLEYINTNAEPHNTQRIINFKATEYHLSSTIATTLVTIETRNDHMPRVVASPPMDNYGSVYYETEGAVGVVAPDAYISDGDVSGDFITELRVEMLVPTLYDRISLNGNISSDITVSSPSNSHLVLSGSSSVEEYTNALLQITYSFTNDELVAFPSMKYIFLHVSDTAYSTFSSTRFRLVPQNDQQPRFNSSQYNATLNESAPIGYQILQLSSFDADTFNTSETRYSITAGNDDGLFSLSNTSGILTLASPLDHELVMVHTLTVQASDILLETGEAQPNTATVRITVTDTNDNVPMFNQTQYNDTVIEGSPVGTFVLRVFAVDRDSAPHSQLVFSISGPGASDFSITGNGMIVTARDIDRERTPFYSLNVSVSNPGSLAYGMAQVFIGVIDQGDNRPELTLSPLTAVLREPQTVVALATDLNITDRDSGPSLDSANVTLFGTGTPGSLFVSVSLPAGLSLSGNNSNKLLISGLSSLPVYETILRSVQYRDDALEPIAINRSVVYRVYGGGLYSFEMTFVVSVETINDNAPVVSLSSLSLDGSFNTSYREDSEPVSITDESLSITDSDSGVKEISYAVVELVATPDGDQERLLYTLSRGISLDAHSTEHRLILRGPGTSEDFRVVLRTIR